MHTQNTHRVTYLESLEKRRPCKPGTGFFHPTWREKKCVRQPLATWLSVRFIMSAFKSLTSTPDFTDLDRIVTDPLCQQLGLDCIGLSRLLQINLEEAGIFPTPV